MTFAKSFLFVPHCSRYWRIVTDFTITSRETHGAPRRALEARAEGSPERYGNGPMVAHCHIQIREIAKGVAGHLYERLIGDPRYYEA